MKKREKGISCKLPMIKIYKDELSAVFNILKEYADAEPIIVTGDYEYETVEELDSVDMEKTNDLTIACGLNEYVVHFNKFRCEINSSKGDAQAEGVVRKIEKVLQKAKRHIQPYLFSRFWLLPIISVASVIAMIMLPFGRLYLAFTPWALVLPIMAWESIWKLQYYSTIVFKYRKNNPSFWKRNKDKLLLLLIGAFLGYVIPALVKIIEAAFFNKGT